MSPMDTEWMDEVLHLNTRIVSAEVCLRAEAVRIVVMMDTRDDITEAARRFTACQKSLRLLRLRRDAMLTQLEVEK